jgi:hypothetical protein
LPFKNFLQKGGFIPAFSSKTRLPMQKLLSLGAVAIILSLFSCKNDPKSANTDLNPEHQPVAQASPKNLAGFWINSGFVTQVGGTGSVIKSINSHHLPYAYMLFFDEKAPSKVAVSNGAEGRVLDVVYKRDTVEMKDAQNSKSVFLVYDSETGGKAITMFDGTGSGPTQMDEFVKSASDLTEGNLIFANALNYNLFGKKFHLAGNPKAQVILDPKGLVAGLDDWTGYQVCLRGSCFKMGPMMDIVNFSNKNTQKQELYGWEYTPNLDTLQFYKLRPSANPDSVYTVVGKAWTLISGATAARPLK